MLVQAENFRKKFRSLPIPHLRMPLKHAAPLPSSHFGFSAQARKHLFRVAFPLLGHFQKLLRNKGLHLLLVGLAFARKCLTNQSREKLPAQADAIGGDCVEEIINEVLVALVH